MAPSTKKKRKKKRRIWLWLIILFVVVAGISQLPAVKNATGRGERAIEVRVEPVERVDLLESLVSATGEIQAKESVDLQTEIAGLIVELPVEEGDRVEKDQVLVKIDPVQTLRDVRAAEAQFDASKADSDSARARIASSKAELAQARFQLKSAEVDREQGHVSHLRSSALAKRQKQLFEENLISAEEYEIAETQVRLDAARIAAAEAGIDQAKARIDAFVLAIEQAESGAQAAESRATAAQANVERLQDLLERTTIRSPISGLIVRRNVDLGERAVPGVLSNPQATLLTIADLSEIEASIEVDETDIVNVALGDECEVVVDALPDDPLQGDVTEIGNSPISTSSNEAKDFKVVIRIDDPPDVLRPGLSCTAEITTDRKEKVLVLPIAALVVREMYVSDDGEPIEPVEKRETKPEARAGIQAAEPTEEETDGKAEDDRKKEEVEGVFIRDEAGFARFRPVETGITGDITIELLEGLEEGDTVITGPYKTLRTLQDGDKVRVTNRDDDGDEKK